MDGTGEAVGVGVGGSGMAVACGVAAGGGGNVEVVAGGAVVGTSGVSAVGTGGRVAVAEGAAISGAELASSGMFGSSGGRGTRVISMRGVLAAPVVGTTGGVRVATDDGTDTAGAGSSLSATSLISRTSATRKRSSAPPR